MAGTAHLAGHERWPGMPTSGRYVYKTASGWYWQCDLCGDSQPGSSDAMTDAFSLAVEYQASNGIKVDSETQGITGLRRITFDHGNHGTSVEMSAEEAVALIESLDHEKDDELGRWRWPENPDYVVYAPVGYSHYVRVLDERSAILEVIHREHLEGRGSLMAQAARAYFEAHPDRRPWNDAEEGDIWVLTGAGGLEQPWRRVNGVWRSIGTDRERTYDAVAARSGRRIWPEDAS